MKMGTHQTGGIRFLSGEDMQKIHEQALVILQKTGIEIASKEDSQVSGRPR
jgi:trimethylamine:corrinoid methyltransferase-like protein